MKTQPPDLAEKLQVLSHRAGVYLFKDRLNRVIYVGKARDLHRRVHQYFHPSRRVKADLKTRALVESVWDMEIHEVKSEPEALLLEGRLIKEYRPKYNVSFRDDKRFLMVKINEKELFPRFAMTRLKKDDGARYFGPFVHSGALRKTLHEIHKRFHIRSCRPQEPDEKEHKHCLDDVIKNCSAPCIGRVTREEYLAKVREACEFLEGQAGERLATVEKEMREAADKLNFEKAATLRNLIEDMRTTIRPMRRFERDLPTTVIPEKDILELQSALALPSVPAHIECFDISNISNTHMVASLVVFRNGRPDRYNYRRYRIRTVIGQNDFACMNEVVFRRYRRVLGSVSGVGVGGAGRLPDLVVVDGGKGQLGAALAAFERLGVAHCPLIGLAKENEEVYRVGEHQPLVMPRTSGALRLLQRVRDEAHRVANEYHQLLLKRRVSESLLDECPGVSEGRKKVLLEEFGSVKMLRAATVEEIAATPGIGGKLAQQIHDFLAAQKSEKTHDGRHF